MALAGGVAEDSAAAPAVAGVVVAVASAAEVRVATGNSPEWARPFLSNDEAQKISEIIRQVEAKTQGEIVPVIVRTSSPLRGVLINCVLFCVALFGSLEMHYFRAQEPWSLLIAMVLAVVIGLGLAQIQSIQRFCLPDADEIKAVHERAELEFYREKVHSTQERTGILIFISLLERRVVILADQGISEKLTPQVWEKVVEGLLGHIRKNDLGIGLTQAIESCGELLAASFPSRPGDTNELSNDLVFKD